MAHAPAIRGRAAGARSCAGGVEKELSGGENATTNNRMEMMAAMAALEALKPPAVTVGFIDSNYVQQGITEWLPDWISARLENGG